MAVLYVASSVKEAIPYLQLKLMRRWTSQLKCKWILDVVEAWSSYSFIGKRHSIFNRMIRRYLAMGIFWSDLVITISSATAMSLQSNYGVIESKLAIIPLGVDLNQIGKLSTMPDNSRKFDVVTIGRLVRIKHQFDILKALWLLKYNHDWNGKAVFIGDGPLKNFLVKQCKKLRISENVEIRGLVTDIEKLNLLMNSRVFVLSSEREGFSLATLEALHCGLPVIVAVPNDQEVFGVSDFVKNGFNGLYYRVGDYNDLSEKIFQLLNDKEEIRRLAENAKLTALSYDWDHMASRLEAVFIPHQNSVK